MPPNDILTNLRSSARAIERPSEVLPTPGGPTKHRIGVCNVRRFAAVTGDDSGSTGESGAGGDAGGSAGRRAGGEMSAPGSDDTGDPTAERGGVPASTGPALSDAAFARIRSRTASHSRILSLTFVRP